MTTGPVLYHRHEGIVTLMRLGRTRTAVSGLTCILRETSFISQKLAKEKKIARSSALRVGFKIPTTVNGYSAISSPS